MNCYTDELGRQNIVYAHADRWCHWHDAGFHKFETCCNLKSKGFHATEDESLQQQRDARIEREQVKHEIFQKIYKRTETDKKFLKEIHTEYDKIMSRIRVPDHPPCAMTKYKKETSLKKTLQDGGVIS